MISFYYEEDNTKVIGLDGFLKKPQTTIIDVASTDNTAFAVELLTSCSSDIFEDLAASRMGVPSVLKTLSLPSHWASRAQFSRGDL